MKGLLVVAIIALMAGGALADPDVLPVKGARYASYNLVTGKLTATEAPTRFGPSIWGATADSPWYFGSYDDGRTVLDWADVVEQTPGSGTAIGGFAFAYGTDLELPARLDAVIGFYGDDDGWNSNGRVFLAGYRIPNLPTGTGTDNMWIITVDLEPGWRFRIQGNDLDGDGLIDFSYTYWFQNLPADSATGPRFGSDPNASQPLPPGAEWEFDAFSDPNLASGSYIGTYWF